MQKRLFGRLTKSMEQMSEIVRGERSPSREFFIDPEQIKALREQFNLSQAKFARMLDIDIGTLRNWEQGRREPSGPARALLRAIKKDPRNVLSALVA